MEIFEQAKFKVPERTSSLVDEPLVVHRHPERREALVVLIHGLGGSRYGTWQNFPRFLFEDLSDAVDVGLYSYRTAWRRLKLTASVDLEQEARVLADIVRDSRPWR